MVRALRLVPSASMGRNIRVVGLSMSGSAALMLSAYHPQQFVYAGSMSGSPSGNHSWPYWGAQLTALKPDLIATLNR
jgi:S-formylglutathione hydrolase FrmB